MRHWWTFCRVVPSFRFFVEARLQQQAEKERRLGEQAKFERDEFERIIEALGEKRDYGIGYCGNLSNNWKIWTRIRQMDAFKYTYLYSFNVKTLMFLRVLPHQYVVFYSSIRCYFEVQMQQEEAERHRQVEEHQLRVQHAQVWGLRGKSKTQDHWIRKFNVFFFLGGGMFMKHVVCTWLVVFAFLANSCQFLPPFFGKFMKFAAWIMP